MKSVLFAAILHFAASAATQVNVSDLATDGTGTPWKTGYLHFQLQNCGANIPQTPAVTGSFVVQDSFDIRPSSLNGPISGTVWGNDQIFCGNVRSSYWLITPMKDAARPLRDGVAYVICENPGLLTCGFSMFSRAASFSDDLWESWRSASST